MELPKKHEQPKVIKPGSTPEPIEAGCCLRSCGGKPGGMQSGKHLQNQCAETMAFLGQASSSLMS